MFPTHFKECPNCGSDIIFLENAMMVWKKQYNVDKKTGKVLENTCIEFTESIDNVFRIYRCTKCDWANGGASTWNKK